MKAFFKKHQDWILGFLALALLAVLVFYFIWGITAVAVGINKAVNPVRTSSESTLFNIEGAKALGIAIQE